MVIQYDGIICIMYHVYDMIFSHHFQLVTRPTVSEREARHELYNKFSSMNWSAPGAKADFRKRLDESTIKHTCVYKRQGRYSVRHNYMFIFLVVYRADLTRVAIPFEIYEKSLRRVS